MHRIVMFGLNILVYLQEKYIAESFDLCLKSNT